jgi:hypothetical protein
MVRSCQAAQDIEKCDIGHTVTFPAVL